MLDVSDIVFYCLHQVNETLTKVDNSIGRLVKGLKERGIYDCVNLIVVSDHGKILNSIKFLIGMTTVDDDKVYSLVPEV